MPFLRVGPGARRDVVFLCAPVPSPSPSSPLDGFLLQRCVAPGALSLWAPARHLGRFHAPLPECPSLPLALPLPVPFTFPGCWWWGGGGRRWPRPGVGWPGAIGGWFGGCRGGEGPRPRPGGGPPHAACGMMASRGGVVAVGERAGADLLEGVHHVHPFSTSRSPGPLHPAAELLPSGGRPPGEVRRGLGGEGSELEVLEWREEEVDMRRWRAGGAPGSGSGGGGDWGWRTGTGDGGNGKSGGACGGRGWWTWGGGGVPGGAWVSRSGSVGDWG